MIQIPGYTIEKELGRGGMASVYLAKQEFTKRHVAIKIMDPKLASDPSFGERFLKEASTAELNHSNIVSVFDAGEAEHQYYIVMEHIVGGDLTKKIQKGITIYESVKAIKQIATALSFAHSKGYVHRDVKPDNILFREDGTAVLTDFGIAKATTATTKMTAVGMAIGSPHYMSPEQARGKELDGRSDMYSLGVVFYEMLTGGKPFDAEDTFAIGLMHISDPVPDLPADKAYLQPFINKMMAKEPSARFSNADELIEALDHINLGDRSVGSTVLLDSVALAKASGKKKSRLIPIMVGSLVAVSAVATGYYYQSVWLPQQAQIKKVQDQQQVKIASLLLQGQTFLRANALISPKGANANESFHEVLALEKTNKDALAGLNQIVNKYLAFAHTEEKRKQYKKALGYVESGLRVIKDHNGLLALQGELQAAIEAQLANQQEQDAARKQRLAEAAARNKAEKEMRDKEALAKRKAEQEQRRLAALKRKQEDEAARAKILAEQRKLLDEIKKAKEDLAKAKINKPIPRRNGKKQFYTGPNKKVLVVGYLFLEDKAEILQGKLKSIVKGHVSKDVTISILEDSEEAYSFVGGNSKGRASRKQCNEKKVDLVFSGGADNPGSGHWGVIPSYVSIYNCDSRQFETDEFETEKGGRIGQIAEHFRDSILNYFSKR